MFRFIRTTFQVLKLVNTDHDADKKQKFSDACFWGTCKSLNFYMFFAIWYRLDTEKNFNVKFQAIDNGIYLQPIRVLDVNFDVNFADLQAD